MRRPPPRRRHQSPAHAERGYRIGLGARRRPRILRILDGLDAALALQQDIDALDEQLQDEDLDDCPWCGALIERGSGDAFERGSRHIRLVSFSMKLYWGPLQFDESDPDDWQVALLIDDEWRWMSLNRPFEPGEPYRVQAEVCSDRCDEAFMAAVRRTTAARRPH